MAPDEHLKLTPVSQDFMMSVRGKRSDRSVKWDIVVDLKQVTNPTAKVVSVNH